MEEANGAGMDMTDRVEPPITISGEAGGATTSKDTNNNLAVVLGARPKVNEKSQLELVTQQNFFRHEDTSQGLGRPIRRGRWRSRGRTKLRLARWCTTGEQMVTMKPG